MRLLRLIDDIASYWSSDIKRQTGKGFFQTFFNTGNYGEFLTYKYLFFLPGKRDFLHNCYVPIDNGFTEIDLIMIDETGIYVIESKNYSGWIFGDEKQKQWTQVIAGGRTKNHFFNPIWQNKGHIKAIKEYFSEYDDIPIYSLVIFSERCQLKRVTYSSENTFVIKRDRLRSTAKNIIKSGSTIPVEMRMDIFQRLKPLCRMEEEDKQKHINRIDHIKTAQSLTAPEIQDNPTDDFGICPRCGSKLVQRNGKNGPFIGCSAFPKCRFTRS